MAEKSGETARSVFWDMPLVLVYAWEHFSLRSNGIDTKPTGEDNGGEDLLNLLKDL